MLWHADIRLPSCATLPDWRVSLVWSNHADGERIKDRYAREIPRFETLPLSRFEVIEVETTPDASRVTKWLVRGHWTTDLDLVFALIPTHKTSWFVKTVWVNERNDTHKTLDRSKYHA
jgi:hypothetical protein